MNLDEIEDALENDLLNKKPVAVDPKTALIRLLRCKEFFYENENGWYICKACTAMICTIHPKGCEHAKKHAIDCPVGQAEKAVETNG